MRARPPDEQGHVDVDGVKIGWEVFGDGAPTLLLMPTWTLIHSRVWKLQVPYLARHFRVVTYDGPGNGRSDRPVDPAVYHHDRQVGTALSVMDATDTDRAVVVSLSRGTYWGLHLAANHPDRILGSVFIGTSMPLSSQTGVRGEAMRHFAGPAPELPPSGAPFDPDPDEHWAKFNAAYWREHWQDFARFFFGQDFTEPHSTKQIEDCLGWAADTNPEVLLAEVAGAQDPKREQLLEWCSKVDSPSLVLHGSDDRITPFERGRVLARATGAQLVTIEGAGHAPIARDPVRANLAIREFVDRLVPFDPHPIKWIRGRSRTRRALYVSSPIGLGHVRRDIAIAQELRVLHPDLQIDWLAQHPVTEALAHAGEAVHPASRHLASESAHIASEADGHDLHCFQAWRRMDEILLADFMVFHDVVSGTDYDLVVGDEAWDVDYYLHENPELKRFAYAWSTDFVGWLPMPVGGEHEARLTADYNAEMIEHIARHPRVRDAALFVGNPEDIVDERFGPNLPPIREWTEAHYTFPGYITGFDPRAIGDRDELRVRLGYRPDEQICIVTVGGSGVGSDLLGRVIDAFPAAREKVPALRMVVVAGPRIDPGSLPRHEGLEVRGYVDELYRHLAVCDLAIVQGGLTSCMELTASGRPFIYIPLRNHFEQQRHVHHRLRRHGAGRRLDDEEATPDGIAATIAEEIGRADLNYRPVETDGAARAAATIAALI